MSFPFTITEHLIDAQYIREYPRATTIQNAPLKLCIKQYTPFDNPEPQPGDLTIVAAHGTGFAKELYEPLWEELYARSKKEGFRIRSIWIADAANQGASGIHNENYLGNDPSWTDHSRDMLLMINQFRDKMPRPIMGVGHSVGGTQLVLLSVIHPRLFTSLLLVEPYIIDSSLDGNGPHLVFMTAKKRDTWPSRAAAAEKARKYLRFWDPRVLDRFARWGYRDIPTVTHPQESQTIDSGRPVTLATTKYQEAMMYTRANPRRHQQLGLPDEHNKSENDGPSPPHDPLFFPDILGGLLPNQRAYRPEPILAGRVLPYLRPSVLFLCGAQSPLSKSGAHVRMAKRTGTDFGGSGGMNHGRVRHLSIEKAGHTLPLEKVSETAEELGPWIKQELQQWKEDERRIAEGWEGLSTRERSMFSNDWKRVVAETMNEPAIEKLSKLSKL
ncbi:toxin biosynthesis protein [Aspergillus heteromorphus CBS 117.55]|uniref:Toxin biosynthesis protein n=1 Tax=Aspergillus heteromorphus CBS 117.55 TaxID=1448321 RepID=A0A317X3Q8_9EURO|nr:toxin biosynthesis protein [Aspergillus heteromorphus CBS 117.55]PWY92801.1 toxin biosynthesis protein [Aspergillus heteromorphus CBS 117.55]